MRQLPLCLLGCLVWSAPVHALLIAAPFADHYAARELGVPPGDLGRLGGIAFDATNPDVLYLGGQANGPLAKIYAVDVVRDADMHIVGYGAASTLVASAAGVTGGIDGGLAFGPGGVLFYTTFRDNQLGQIKPGSSAPDRLIDLGALGVARSTGTLQFVPAGMPGAGRLKIVSFSRSTWYDASVAPADDGTYDVSLSGVSRAIGGGPEGVVYVAAGNPGFEQDAVLVSEWSNGVVATYDIDANGDPLVATRRVFMSDLGNAEGAAIDPYTGDFLFSRFAGDDRGVVVVGGFAPPQPVPLPGALGAMLAALAVLGTRRRVAS